MKSRKGFTLVELLVVIGIIAVLISILLPTLGRVRKQATLVACGANLRSLVQGIQIYAAENKNSLPYGLSYAGMSNNTGAPTSGGWVVGGYTYRYRFNWWTQINAGPTKDRAGGLWPDPQSPTPFSLARFQPQLSSAFLCPEAANGDSLTNFTRSHYGFNMVAMPNRSYEFDPKTPANYSGNSAGFNFGGTFYDGVRTAAIAPAKMGALFGDTALLWDNQVMVAPPGFYYNHTVQGMVPWTGAGGGLQFAPRINAYRYRGAGDTGEPEQVGSNPIWYPTTATETAIYANRRWANADSLDGVYVTFFYPSPRFRHGKNNTANVAFADGSVRSVQINQDKLAYVDSFGSEVCESDFKIDWLKLKRPGGLSPLAQ